MHPAVQSLIGTAITPIKTLVAVGEPRHTCAVAARHDYTGA
jgi:hypothetical protein